MAVNINLDGQAYSFPDWATESTQDQIKDILTAMAKQSGVSDASLKKLLKSTEDMVDQLKDDAKEATKTADEQKKRDEANLKVAKQFSAGINQISEELGNLQDNLDADSSKGFFGRVRSNLEADGEQLGAALGRTAEVFLGAAAGVAATVTGFSGYVFAQLKGAGETINDMTKVGVGFNTTYSELGMSTTQAVGYLGALGVGFEGAAKLIAKNSNVVATQGFGRFNQTMKYAADVSENLGMSFDDSMETFADALSRRQSLINLGNVSQQRVNQTVATTVKMQTAYATALGVSTDELAAFVDSLVRDNGLLTSALLGMSDTVRNDVVAGIEVFASGMASMGGKAGQDIAAAFLEAGSAGAVGLSDAAVGIVTALPQLRGPMNDFVGAIQSGTLSQDDANAMVQDITKDLANLSDSEKQRIQLMARTGDESAKMMANAIAQFEQSEKALSQINKDLGTGFNMDAVQQGTNNFNKIIAQVSGGASNAFYSLFADPGVLDLIKDGLGEIMDAFGFGVDSMSGIAQEGGRELGQKFLPMLKTAVKFVVDQLKAVAEYVKSFKDSSGNIDFGALFEDVFSKVKSAVVGSLIKGVAMFAVGLFGFSMAKEFAKSILMPQLKSFMGSIFSKQGATAAAGIAQQAMGAAGGAVSSAAGTAGNAGGVGAAAADKLKTVMGKGDDLTDKLEDAVSGGGGGTGFLKKIADGVKEFGSNKVVKGAASLVILASALTVAAVGFKTFNDVNWDSLVKGGLAIGGLVLLAKRLGDGSTKMIKGAAAIAILGASVIPLAAGLRIMEDVGLMTIVNLAAALTTLGVAGSILGKLVGQLVPGAAAIAMLGASIIPLALALNLMKDVGFETIGVLAAGLVTLGIASIALGAALPFVIAGSVAMAALGVALLPLSLGLALAGGGMKMLSEGLKTIQDLNMLDIVGSLLGLGAAMTALILFVPGMLASAVALSAVGVALLPFAATAALAGAGVTALSAGLKALQDLSILEVTGSLLALGAAFTLMIPLLPGLILTSAALSIAGVAMLPFAAAALLVAPATMLMAKGLGMLADISILDAVGSLLALGVAMNGMLLFIPGMLIASAALGAIGIALLPFAAGAVVGGAAAGVLGAGLKSLAEVPLLSLTGGLLALSAGMVGVAALSPLMLIAGAAMAAFGVTLLPFALGASLAAGALESFAPAMVSLNDVNWLNLMLAGPALLSLAAGMMALSGGGLVSGLIDGIGKLFGADSPFDKLADIANNAQYIILMAEELRNFDDTLDVFKEHLAELDGEAAGAQFRAIAEGIYAMQEAISGLSMGSIAKLATMKLLGVAPKAPDSAGYFQGKSEQATANVTEFAGSSSILTQANKFELVKMRQQRNMALASGATAVDKAGNPIQVNQEAVPTVAQQAPQATTPAPALQQTAQAQSAAANMTPPEQGGPTQTELLQELVRLQAENNRLAKKTRGAIDNIEV